MKKIIFASAICCAAATSSAATGNVCQGIEQIYALHAHAGLDKFVPEYGFDMNNWIVSRSPPQVVPDGMSNFVVKLAQVVELYASGSGPASPLALLGLAWL